MPKTNFQSVDDYIAAQPESIRDTLQRIRAILRKALPSAEEAHRATQRGAKPMRHNSG